MTMIVQRRRNEEGATAIIVVVFSVLLLVTISLGFMRMVIQEQTRSLENELSRGAYDSAVAGVEDGKRVLEECRLNSSSPSCAAIAAQECDTTARAGIVSTINNEVKLQTTGGVDGGFDQAYTCVKISPDTPDFQGSLETDSSRIIPLETTGSFTQLRVSWFRNPGASQVVAFPAVPATPRFPTLSNWVAAPAVRPPVLRVQLIMYQEGTSTPADFDSPDGGRTVYLYPAGTTGLSAGSFATDTRAASPANILRSQCSTVGTYMCSMVLDLPRQITPTAPAGRVMAYLRVTSVYAGADFSVSPVGVSFNGVQPIVDSTGRASDVFRRVSARVERLNVNDAQLYPRATADVTGSFCKAFGVTSNEYVGPSNCTLYP